jgi:hypothetical protein
MKRTPLRRRAQLRARKPLRRTTPLQRTDSMAASEAQRAAVAGRPCIACGAEHRVDAAHLIPRSLGGCGDPLCVVPLCRRPCHRAYPSLSTSGETLTIEESMSLEGENGECRNVGVEHEWSWSCG